jgi:hypothetical protein
MEPVVIPPLKSRDEVKAVLKEYLKAVDVEIVEEFDHPDTWGFLLKFGNFPILVQKPEGFRVLCGGIPDHPFR